MARQQYTYNPETCRYEPVVVNRRKVLTDGLVFVVVSIAAGVVLFVLGRPRESFTEQWLAMQNDHLNKEWVHIEKRIAHSQQELQEFIHKDDRNYRIILDSEPLDNSIREAGIGGSENSDLAEIQNFPGISRNYQRMDKLQRQVHIELQSFQEIQQMLDEKIKIWSSRPAIQPIDNRQLDRLHLTFGLRMHPIFKVLRDHKGLDFTASQGTPVYATGDGKVAQAYFSGSYGNVIYIQHGYGFETRYAHLSKFEAKPGEQVKRGQVIGYVGNTGHSVSAHLHYEVLYKGDHVNPINFFQRDLTNQEYEKLIQLGSEQSTPLD